MALVLDWPKIRAIKGNGDINCYVCESCRDAGRPHELIEVPAGPAPNWGGAPSHWRECTGCGFRDGPWVKADHVGGGY